MLEISTNREIKIIQTTAELTMNDILGSWKARWGINRMNYKVEPGLYSIGDPDKCTKRDENSYTCNNYINILRDNVDFG